LDELGKRRIIKWSKLREMSLKIAIIGEGKNDFGWPVFGDNDSWNEGAVQIFLRKLFGNLEVEFIAIRGGRTSNLGGGRYKKRKLKGAANKVFPFLQKHLKEDFDLLVFYSDSDKTQGKKASEREAIKKYKDRRTEVLNGLELVKEVKHLDSVMMIPIRMIENWLLSDANAFKKVLVRFLTNPNCRINQNLFGEMNKTKTAIIPKIIFKMCWSNMEKTHTLKFLKRLQNTLK